MRSIDEMARFAKMVRYIALSVGTTYLSSKLIGHAGKLLPQHADRIHYWAWLVVVLAICVAFLRPIFLLYTDETPR